MSKSILLIDDQERFLNTLKNVIETLDYSVDISIDAAGALHLVTLKKYDAIISDIQMPGMSGLDFLNKAKELTKAPVILMTAFSESADVANYHAKGAKGFIAKPFKLEELKIVLDEVTGAKVEVKANEQKNLDDDFFPLLVDEFLSGKTIQYDIFVRINASRYLKIAHGGEDLDPDRVAKFKEKGVRMLYLRKEDYKRYVSFLLNLSAKATEHRGIESERKIKILKVAGETALRGMFHGAMRDPELSEAKMIVNSVNRLVCEDEKLSDLMLALKSSGDALYTHAMGVSTLAVMIARELKWTSQTSVLSIGLAGFFHDIGKKELPKALLEKGRAYYTAEEVALYESHSVRGANILATIPKFPSEVIQAVLEHHELCSGVGFPKHISKNKIIPIARILAIADEFAKGILHGPDCLHLEPLEMFQRMKRLKADYFDHQYLEALHCLLVKPE